MDIPRVVVTGIGVVSGLGYGVQAFQDALFAGRPGFTPLQPPHDMPLRIRQAAQVPDYNPAAHFDRKQQRYLDRFAQFGVLAAQEAIAMAGIPWTDAQRETTGIVTGTCLGGQTTIDDGFVTLYRKGTPRVPPTTIPNAMSNAAASYIGMTYGIHGPTYTVSTACSSASHAIGNAYQMLCGGQIDVAIAGGSEAPLSYGNLKAWEALRVVSEDTCRPFSKDRSGMVLGEGGGMLVLETFTSAQARGATILGELVGYGLSADAHHLTQPSADGAARTMRMALRSAGLPPEAIGYINAHGTGTHANDPMEASAIRAVFGTHATTLPVSSTKSMHGHTLGAAGALEAIATLLALQHQTAPPTANFTEVDPACADLHVVANTAQPVDAAYALSNSFAFGGLNAVLVFRTIVHD